MITIYLYHVTVITQEDFKNQHVHRDNHNKNCSQ